MAFTAVDLAAAVAVLQRQRDHVAPTPANLWAALPLPLRCLLSSGWVLERIQRLAVTAACDGYSPAEIGDLVWRLETDEFPYQRTGRAEWIRPWTDVLYGITPCGHDDPQHAQPGASAHLLLHSLLSSGGCASEDYYLS